IGHPAGSSRLSVLRSTEQCPEVVKSITVNTAQFGATFGVNLTPTSTSEPTGTPTPTSTSTPTPSGVTDHYVSLNGDDANPGTIDLPWRTIQHAAGVVQQGDTVHVEAGTYVEGVDFTTSGTAGQPITFNTNGHAVTVQGNMNLRQGTSHLRLHGFTLRGFSVWGLTLWGDNQDVVLSGLNVGGGEAGIHFTIGYSGQPPEYGPVENVTLADSVIHGAKYTSVDCTPGPCNNMRFQRLEIYGSEEAADWGADGLAVERGQDILVEDCYIHDNGGDGIDINSRDAPGSVSGIVVRRNRVENNQRNGVKLWAGGQMVDNDVWNSGDTALLLEAGSSYTVNDNTIANRTSYGYLATLGGYDTSIPTSINLHNNTFYNDNPSMGGTTVYYPQGAILTADYNLYYNPYREDDVICAGFLGRCFSSNEINDGTWYAASGCGEHSEYANTFSASTPTPIGTNTATPTNTPTPTDTPMPTPTPGTEIDKWSLWTGGTRLRGANIWQRRVYPELDGTTFLGSGSVGPSYTQEDFDRLAALGANYVNISHPGLFTEDPPYVLGQDIRDNLDNLLGMIEQAGMFAVISFRTGPGRSEFTFVWDEVGDWFNESYLNDSIWQDQTAQDAWVEMWSYTAQRYRDNPIVVGYDLIVEPNSNEVGSHALNDALDIWDPEEFYSNYGGTLYDWNQLYPRITNAIRQVDTYTPILIGGNGYSAVDWLPYLQPTGDPRTVYMVHQYESFKYTHQDSGAQDCIYPVEHWGQNTIYPPTTPSVGPTPASSVFSQCTTWPSGRLAKHALRARGRDLAAGTERATPSIQVESRYPFSQQTKFSTVRR
ncbi:MAG: right-handed parallel beta-helix repeat-containing protein, partial [Chloroflexota bacterium]|nr:right-handed parallel beta-helix repeat-containing protein [Chloroflexota bacterium]